MDFYNALGTGSFVIVHFEFLKHCFKANRRALACTLVLHHVRGVVQKCQVEPGRDGVKGAVWMRCIV